jgi:bifunctional DNA-binding transcriptional regulator/antitoxin component of YhaV-PrlF toxin-antitoxin module
MSTAYLELNAQGNLVIPRELLKELGFEPTDKIKVEVEAGRMIVFTAKENIDSILEESFGDALIPADEFAAAFKDWIKPEITFEQLDELFKGKSLPIEETIRHEREEREK